MPISTEKATANAKNELTTTWMQVKNANEMKALVNNVLHQAFDSVNKNEHFRLYRQISLLLHQDSMRPEWKEHLTKINIDVDLPFKQLEGYLAPSKIQLVTSNEKNLRDLALKWVMKSFSNLDYYPQPFRVFALFIQGIVAVALAIIVLVRKAATTLTIAAKDFFVNGLINVVTLGGLNQEIDNFEINHKEEYDHYSDQVLLYTRSFAILMIQQNIELNTIRLKMEDRFDDTERSKMQGELSTLNENLELITKMTLDEYEGIIKSNTNLSDVHKKACKEFIENDGFNSIIHTARAIWHSVSSPLPESWFLKPFAVLLRSLQLVIGIAVIMPLAITNWLVSRILAGTAMLVDSAAALVFAATAAIINLPLLIKDALTSLSSVEEDPKEPRPTVSQNRYATFSAPVSEQERQSLLQDSAAVAGV